MSGRKESEKKSRAKRSAKRAARRAAITPADVFTSRLESYVSVSGTTIPSPSAPWTLRKDMKNLSLDELAIFIARRLASGQLDPREVFRLIGLKRKDNREFG